jgi:hypothetical protein
MGKMREMGGMREMRKNNSYNALACTFNASLITNYEELLMNQNTTQTLGCWAHDY